MFRSFLKRVDAGNAKITPEKTSFRTPQQQPDDRRDDDVSISTPAVPQQHQQPSCSCAAMEELQKLRRENRQLRQELTDANYRIRQLEENSLKVIIPDSSIDDDDSSLDNFSVEISTAPSATSSTTTIPTGSPEATESRQRQQQREAAKNKKKNSRKNSRNYMGYNMTSAFPRDRPYNFPFSMIPEDGPRSSSACDDDDSSCEETYESTSSFEGLQRYHRYNAKSFLSPTQRQLQPEMLRRVPSNSSETSSDSVSSLESFMRYHDLSTTSLLQQDSAMESNMSEEEDPLCEI